VTRSDEGPSQIELPERNFLPDLRPTGAHAHGGHAHGGHAHGGHAHGEADEAASYSFVSGALPHRVGLERGAGRGKILFFDCASGIAGDMTMAALLDLGIPSSVVTDALSQLPNFSARMVVSSGHVGALGACQVSVEYDAGREHRPYGEIREMLERSTLEAKTRQLAQAVFRILADAEGEVHRVRPDEVEFHEVGSADAIVDVVGVCALVSYLGADVAVSSLPLGRGWVDTAHGRLPLPAPATLLCLKGVPTRSSGLEAELVTPTGAALVRALAQSFEEWPSLHPERVGMGAGHRTLRDRPNVLRAILGSPVQPGRGRTDVVTLEANLDDMTPEVLAHVQSRLLQAGALDVWFSPISMKKSRPGVVLSALSKLESTERLTDLIFAETTTLGVRQTRATRSELPRRIEELPTRFGPVRYKISGEPVMRIKVEVDDAIAIATRENMPLSAVLHELDDLGRHTFLVPRGA
jgi:pyridinium-3,5-bisthiocarboxylic acid mononucleotide nickel chelatase